MSELKLAAYKEDGTPILIKASDLGALMVAQQGAAFDAAVAKGNVFHTASQATVTTQAGLSATTPALTIANKNGSGKSVKLWHVAVGSLVSTSACAQIYAAFGAKHATAVIIRRMSISNSKTVYYRISASY